MIASGNGVGVGVGVGTGVAVGLGVGVGETEGGGLNFGPGQPARKKQRQKTRKLSPVAATVLLGLWRCLVLRVEPKRLSLSRLRAQSPSQRSDGDCALS
jgi:hypothetical protein